MKAHGRLTQEAQDHVALYVLGGMPKAEASRFEEHLEICRPCRQEVSTLRPVVDDLVLVAPEADPPPGLKARVLERAGRTPCTLLPAAERTWLASGVTGVELFQLWLDSENERQTILIRMQAGTSLPNHLHGGTEECFIVQGDLRESDRHLGTGDYIRFEGGTRHTVSSDDGCLLLVSSSLHDQLVNPPPDVA